MVKFEISAKLRYFGEITDMSCKSVRKYIFGGWERKEKVPDIPLGTTVRDSVHHIKR